MDALLFELLFVRGVKDTKRRVDEGLDSEKREKLSETKGNETKGGNCLLACSLACSLADCEEYAVSGRVSLCELEKGN